MSKRKSFSPEFKREAVRLMETSQKVPADLARELGVRRNQLYKWKEGGRLGSGGCGLTWLREYERSLLGPIVAHMTINCLSLLFFEAK
jgi:hypothetical protein